MSLVFINMGGGWVLMAACYKGGGDGGWERGGGLLNPEKTGRSTDKQTYSLTPFPLILCLPFVMHPPHLQSCHWLVRTNHRMPCCLPAMYQFGQDDIKFLVLRVKDHMKTDVLITGLPRALDYLFNFSQIRGLRNITRFFNSNLIICSS